MSAPLVSVVLPVHDRPQFLAEAAGSVLSQTLRDLELVIVDDGSRNPETPKIVADLVRRDARVRAIRRDKNGGLAAARNAGIAAAQAPLVAFMDDDDICESDRLEKQAAFLESHPEAAMVNCALSWIDKNGAFLRGQPARENRIVFTRPVPPLEKRTGQMNAATHSMVRRDALVTVGLYREWFRNAEDLDLTLRLEEKFSLAKIPERLLRYRRHGRQQSSDGTGWRFGVAAMVSARLRRAGLADPIAEGGEMSDEFLAARFREMPAALRLGVIRKSAGSVRQLFRAGRFEESRRSLSLAAAMRVSREDHRQFARLRARVFLQALAAGKFGFFKAPVSDAFARAVRFPLRKLRNRLLLRIGSALTADDDNFSPEFVSRGIAVSVLLPSRGRPDSLRAALRNIPGTCENPGRVEILLRLDDDDSATLAVRDSLAAECAPVRLRIAVGLRGAGYAAFHLFVNELAGMADGDFLLLHNDDSRIETRGWDALAAARRGRLAVLNPATPNSRLNIFPMAHRKVFELLGHFSLNPHCDSWMESVARRAEIQDDFPGMTMRHIRDEMRDRTFAETSAAYATTLPSFASRESRRGRWADAIRLHRYVARHGRKLAVRESAQAGGKAL